MAIFIFIVWQCAGNFPRSSLFVILRLILQTKRKITNRMSHHLFGAGKLFFDTKKNRYRRGTALYARVGLYFCNNYQ